MLQGTVIGCEAASHCGSVVLEIVCGDWSAEGCLLWVACFRCCWWQVATFHHEVKCWRLCVVSVRLPLIMEVQCWRLCQMMATIGVSSGC